ncbi:MAG: prepilin-type N-terminal cleavage/methylation domain-containing protein [Candidatus Omnitrophica bacterium]|nr:prepilin-type N-terminal cleavage/methylation domain-containing protein [Candidatus Omnitrophota bacterium]
MQRANTSFTLVELLIVIVIIGILATIGIRAMQDVKAKVIADEAVLGMRALVNAVNQYHNINGSYPPFNGVWWIDSYELSTKPYFPDVVFRWAFIPWGSPGFNGPRATLDTQHFCQDSYQYGYFRDKQTGEWNHPGIVVYVNCYENYSRNNSPGAREAYATTDGYPNQDNQFPCLIYFVETNQIYHQGWSKSGYPRWKTCPDAP